MDNGYSSASDEEFTLFKGQIGRHSDGGVFRVWTVRLTLTRCAPNFHSQRAQHPLTHPHTHTHETPPSAAVDLESS